MIRWMWNLLQKIWNWGLDDKHHWWQDKLERRVLRDESPEYDADRMFEGWTEESCPELDDASYVQRLEEEERNHGSRTAGLSEQSTGVLCKDKGSGDLDYSMKEHFFSPLNPNNQ